MPTTIPTICGLGMYDASIVHKNKAKTNQRLVSLYEIEYILEDGGYSHINGNTYQIKKGNVIVAKPGSIRFTEVPFRTLFVHLIVEDNDIASMLDKCPDFFSPENGDDYQNALLEIISASASDAPYKEINVYEKLFSLFSLLMTNAELYTNRSEEAKSNIGVIKAALDFMDNNFRENITLEDVARHVHLSRIYFRSVFVAATGQTPYKYIRSKRLSSAKQLILTTNKSFSEIAVECGFSSQSYMNSVFREEFDKTPKQFREEISLMY